MEAYKKTVRLRAAALALAAVAAAVVFAFGVATGRLAPHPDSGESFDFGNYFAGFQAGALGALTVALAAYTIMQLVVLKNPDALKRRYIAENDERNIFIHRASGGFILHACSIVILIAAAAAGYYSQHVFFSLLGCSLFLMLVKKATRLYLSRKY